MLLFIALYWAFFVFAPRSALYDFSRAETLAGLATVVVAVALVVLRSLPRRLLRFERSIYFVFLAAMPFIYLAAALRLRSGSGIAIELVGVFVFVGLAVFGYYKSFLAFGVAIAAHGPGWDLWHHSSGSYIASWYPFACMLIDLALGFLAVTQASAHQMPNSAARRTARRAELGRWPT